MVRTSSRISLTAWQPHQAFHVLFQTSSLPNSVVGLHCISSRLRVLQDTTVILNSISPAHLKTLSLYVDKNTLFQTNSVAQMFTSTTSSCAKQFLIFSDPK